MITCFIRYEIAREKLPEFERYGRVWMRLIEKYGGTHHGYFVPLDAPPSAAFSFQEIGENGPGNVAVALFSFPDVEAYDGIDVMSRRIPNARRSLSCATRVSVSSSTKEPSCGRSNDSVPVLPR